MARWRQDRQTGVRRHAQSPTQPRQTAESLQQTYRRAQLNEEGHSEPRVPQGIQIPALAGNLPPPRNAVVY